MDASYILRYQVQASASNSYQSIILLIWEDDQKLASITGKLTASGRTLYLISAREEGNCPGIYPGTYVQGDKARVSFSIPVVEGGIRSLNRKPAEKPTQQLCRNREGRERKRDRGWEEKTSNGYLHSEKWCTDAYLLIN